MGKSNIAIVVALTLVAASAQAAEIDVGVGMSHFLGKDGLWYDEAFDHSIKSNSPSAEIGITENAYSGEKFGLDFRQAYVYLGQMKIDAAIPTYDTNTTQGQWVGSDFVGADPSHPCYGTCTHMSRFQGSGFDHGLSLTAQPYYIHGDYKISLIGGLFVHTARFVEQISGALDHSGGTLYNLHVTNDQTGIALGETAGIAIKKGNFALKYQYYRTPFHAFTPSGGDAFPPAWHGTHNITLNWSFK